MKEPIDIARKWAAQIFPSAPLAGNAAVAYIVEAIAEATAELREQCESNGLKCMELDRSLNAMHTSAEKSEAENAELRIAIMELHRRLDSLHARTKDAEERLAKSEAARAELFRLLSKIRRERLSAYDVMDQLDHALSTDAGHDYVPKQQVEEAWRKGMTDAAMFVPFAYPEIAKRIFVARDAKKESAK